MNVHISYKINRTPDIEKEINHQLEKLQKRLQVFRPELVHLKGIIEENSPREGMVVSLNLRLPSGQMAAQESASVAAVAVKATFGDLLQQLTRHKDLLRSSHKWRRRRTGEVQPQVEIPFENTLAAVRPLTISSDDIRSYVNANLGRLDRFVARELFFREAAEQLSPGLVTKDEVVDEVIARALGDGMEKPDRLGLEAWLYRLAIGAINESNELGRDASSEVHLEDSAWKRNVKASDEPALQYHQPDESLTGESVVRDARTATPEEIAYSDEMLALVHLALKNAKAIDRECFILYAIEGFSVDEICAITDRSTELVGSSIAVAREHLRRSTPLANRLEDKLIQRTGAA
jgi:DNA-directed RNA polymerase specialized sigma24 family protein/ribosome-associated translation inhibitor RaiA